jgi:hypothetical protein
METTNIRLVDGLEARPGYIYVAVREDCMSRSKIGLSRNPWQRLTQAMTWEIQHGWELMHVTPTVDCVAAEAEIHRCLRRARIAHLNGERGSEHFDVDHKQAQQVVEMVVQKQAPAEKEFKNRFSNALGTRGDLDAMSWMLEGKVSGFDMAWAVGRALDGDHRGKRVMQSKGLHAMPAKAVVLFNRTQSTPMYKGSGTQMPTEEHQRGAGIHPFVGSQFAPYWEAVFEPYAGFRADGTLVRWAELDKDTLGVAQRLSPNIDITSFRSVV